MLSAFLSCAGVFPFVSVQCVAVASLLNAGQAQFDFSIEPSTAPPALSSGMAAGSPGPTSADPPQDGTYAEAMANAQWISPSRLVAEMERVRLHITFNAALQRRVDQNTVRQAVQQRIAQRGFTVTEGDADGVIHLSLVLDEMTHNDQIFHVWAADIHVSRPYVAFIDGAFRNDQYGLFQTFERDLNEGSSSLIGPAGLNRADSNAAILSVAHRTVDRLPNNPSAYEPADPYPPASFREMSDRDRLVTLRTALRDATGQGAATGSRPPTPGGAVPQAIAVHRPTQNMVAASDLSTQRLENDIRQRLRSAGVTINSNSNYALFPVLSFAARRVTLPFVGSVERYTYGDLYFRTWYTDALLFTDDGAFYWSNILYNVAHTALFSTSLNTMGERSDHEGRIEQLLDESIDAYAAWFAGLQ